MTFPTTSEKIPGYDRDQVDALMLRLETQYQKPQSKLVTSDMLNFVKFDLSLGGYQIPAVDAAIARLAETFLERELAGRLVRGGRDELASELAEILKEIRYVLERGAKKSFSNSSNGYSRSQIKKLISSFSIKRGGLSEIDTYELRIRSFKRKRSGFNRSEVEAFISLLIRASHLQKTLR